MNNIVTRGFGDPHHLVKRGYDGTGYVSGPYHEVLDLSSPEPQSLTVLNVASKVNQSLFATQRFAQTLSLESLLSIEKTS